MRHTALFQRDNLLYVVLPALLFLALGLYILPDFEIFYDEVYETLMARDNVALFLNYISLEPVSRPYDKIFYNLEYYGTFFNLIAYFFQSVFGDGNLLGFESLEIKRYVIFGFSLLAPATLAYAIYRATRSRYSVWLSFGILMLMPLYFFYSFNNPKDIPFAAMMTIVSVVGAQSVMTTLQTPSALLTRRQLKWLLAIGIAIGLCASVRLVGVVTYGFWWLALLICAALQRAFCLKRIILASVIVGASAFIVIWALHPVAYTQPLDWMQTTLRFHSKHPFPGVALTDGEWLHARATPWYFLPKWFLVKIPLLWQVGCVAGLLVAAASLRRQNVWAQAVSIFFFLQLVFIPVAIIVTKARLYGDGRHVLFIYPAIAYFCALALHYAWFLSRRYRYPALALSAFMAVKIAFDMLLLHPYQTAYFIEPVRQDVPVKWMYGSMHGESMLWLSEHTNANKVLVNSRGAKIGWYSHLYSMRPIRAYNMRKRHKIVRPYYLINFGNYVYNQGDFSENCQELHRITRPLGATTLVFTTVSYCP